jgi:DNA repair protein RadC
MRLRSPQDVVRAVRERQSYCPAVEIVLVLVTDAGGRLLKVVEVARGDKRHVAVDPRSICAAVEEAGGDSAVMVHNHPSGDTEPSLDDENLTERVAAEAEACGLALRDHVIMTAAGKHFSFWKRGQHG